jgi:hypothetical protein
VARTSQLIPCFYTRNEIRARGRVFFDLVRAAISLALSLALHLLILHWLAIPGRQTDSVAQNQQIVLSFLNAELTRTLETGLTPHNSGQTPENEMPVTPVTPVTRTPVKPDTTVLPKPEIAAEIYYPRNVLSQKPQLLQDVDLSSLAAIVGNLSKSVTLELFVSEQGTIDRIAFESVELDEAVQEKLEGLLLQLRFSGGEIDGMAVKSRIKIEVLFLAPTRTEEKPTQLSR